MIVKFNEYLIESVRTKMTPKSDEDMLTMDVDAEHLLSYSFANNYIKGIKFVLDNYKLYGKETKNIISYNIDKIQDYDDLNFLINHPQIRKFLNDDKLYVLEKYRLGLHKGEIREFEKILIDLLDKSEFYKSINNPNVMICQNFKENKLYFNYYLKTDKTPNYIDVEQFELIYHLDDFTGCLRFDEDWASDSKYDIPETLLVKGIIQDYFNIKISKCTGARGNRPVINRSNSFVWENVNIELNESKGQTAAERRRKKIIDRKRDKERRAEKWRGVYQDRKTKKKPTTGVEAERIKAHKKEMSKYLNNIEMKELDNQHKETLFAKRKYHGSMNDDDLINNQIIDNKLNIINYNLIQKREG